MSNDHISSFNSSINCQIIKEKQTNQKGKVNVMGEAAMMNAYFICHNVQVKYSFDVRMSARLIFIMYLDLRTLCGSEE